MSSYTAPVIVHFVVLAVLSGLTCSNFYYTDILWKSKMPLHLLLAVVICTVILLLFHKFIWIMVSGMEIHK